MNAPATPHASLAAVKIRLTAYRLWKHFHRWVGLIVMIPLFLIGLTGIVMLDRDRWGLRDTPVRFQPLVTWYAKLNEGRANGRGEGPGGRSASVIRYVTLYRKDGTPVQVGSKGGSLAFQAAGNATWSAPEASLIKTATVPQAPGGAEGPGRGGRAVALTWGRVIDDVHTGRIFNNRLEWYYIVTGSGLATLSLTGFYLWLKPLLTKRAAQKRQKPPSPASVADLGAVPPPPSIGA
jgi:hypothetical protein